MVQKCPRPIIEMTNQILAGKKLTAHSGAGATMQETIWGMARL